MNIYSIPIYGVIGEDTKLTDVLLHLKNAQKYDAIKLLIGSIGGEVREAYKIAKAIKSLNKPIYSVNTGDVCSAAVELFLLADKANRIYIPTRGQFLIHNPWGEIEGEANDLIEAGRELKKIESEKAKMYAAITGTDENIISQFMAENTPLTPEQVEQLGFATVSHAEFKPVAIFNYKQNKMENEVLEKKLSAIEAFMVKVSTFFNPKNMVLQDATGQELDFGSINDLSQIVVGVTATVKGAPATGEYTMPDGSIMKFDNGTLSEIILPKEGNEDIEALKKENESLKAEIESLKESTKKSEQMKADFEALQKEYKEFKMQFTPQKPNLNTPNGEKQRVKIFN